MRLWRPALVGLIALWSFAGWWCPRTPVAQTPLLAQRLQQTQPASQPAFNQKVLANYFAAIECEPATLRTALSARHVIRNTIWKMAVIGGLYYARKPRP
jgi:hypothetical protein